MRFFYTLSVELYVLAVRIASLWNAKAKDWVSGRRDLWKTLDSFDRKQGDLHWFHCASLGEFEQARPLIEELKKEECQIVVTFFSQLILEPTCSSSKYIHQRRLSMLSFLVPL